MKIMLLLPPRYLYITVAILMPLLLILLKQFNTAWQWLLSAVFTLLVTIIAIIDYEHFIIPDSLNYVLLWLGLIVSTTAIFCYPTPTQAIIGAAIGYLSLYSLAYSFKCLLNKEAMGHGDFKLLAALGAWTGWQMLLFIVMISSISALIYSLIISIKVKRSTNIIPFAPFLSLAGWLSFVFHHTIITMFKL